MTGRDAPKGAVGQASGSRRPPVRQRRRRAGDTACMRMVLFAATGFAAAIAAFAVAGTSAQAQESVAPATEIQVVYAAGAYRLQWRDNSANEFGFQVEMLVGKPAGERYPGEFARYSLAKVPPNVTSIELPDGNSELQDGGCFAVVFNVAIVRSKPHPSQLARSEPHTVCTGAGGSFDTWQTPKFDFIQQTPAPVANLRIFRDERNYWNLTWDPSPGAARYDAGIQVLDAEGMVLGQAAFPSVSGITTVRIHTVATEHVGLGCFTAVARVFAVGVDGSVTLPASVTTPVCIGLYELSFPDTGSGAAARDGRSMWLAIAAIGATSVAAGAVTRRRG